MPFPKGNILLSPLPSPDLRLGLGRGVWLLTAMAAHLLPHLLLLAAPPPPSEELFVSGALEGWSCTLRAQRSGPRASERVP